MTRFQIVDHPLFYIELFDQIEHRIVFSQRVINARTVDEIFNVILSSVKSAPSSRESRETAIARQVGITKGTQLSGQLQAYQARVHSGTIKSLFSFFDAERYARVLSDRSRIDTLLTDIDNFRRSSFGDPADNEMHRLIDAMMVASTIGLANSRNDVRLCYWGQDRLRRIFGNRMRDLSRDAASPHIIQQAYLEVPHDREVTNEAKYNVKRRMNEMIDIMDDLYEFRNSLTIPLTLAKACLRRCYDYERFIYGNIEMIKPEDYDRLMRKIIEKPASIKEVFEEASADAKTSSEIVKALASSSVNREALQVLELHPNDRVKHLLREMSR